MIDERPTAEQATAPMNRSLRTRRPTSQLTSAPANGAKMIKLRRFVCCNLVPTKVSVAASPPDVRNAYGFPSRPLFLRGCASQVRHSLIPDSFVGQAKPFRTSGGEARKPIIKVSKHSHHRHPMIRDYEKWR